MAIYVDFQYDILYTLKEHFAYAKTNLNIGNNVYICDERTFKGLDNVEKSAIYVIVNFEKGTIFSGSTIVPVAIQVISESDTFENARQLTSWVALKYNLNSPSVPSNSFVRELYTTSDLNEPFGEDGQFYRATLEMNATFVFGFNILGYKKLIIDNEEIIFLEIEEEMTTIPHTANLGDNYDRTKTINTASTYTITFTFVPISNSAFSTKCLDFMHKTNLSLNETCEVQVQIGDTIYPSATETRTLHFLSLDIRQEIANVPMLAVCLGE